jgi:hypothetical protein
MEWRMANIWRIFCYVHVTALHRNKLLYNRTNWCTNFTNLFWHETLHVSDRDETAVPSWSCSKSVYNPVWYIPLLSVQWINCWWWTEELSETCRVSFQNAFVKLVHLVGFIVKKNGEDYFLSRRRIELGIFGLRAENYKHRLFEKLRLLSFRADCATWSNSEFPELNVIWHWAVSPCTN